MAESKRIRLLFKDDDILSEKQKSEGLIRSLFLLNPQQHDTVSDVAEHLIKVFKLQQSCPNGVLLSISGFVLPPFESTSILKENEIIRITKRRDVLSIEGNDASNGVEKLEDVKKQPLNPEFLLLANEEFEKEKGGYESDEQNEEEDEEVLKEPKNRKRKASDKLDGSKKKKRRSKAPKNAENDEETPTLTDKIDESISGVSRKKKSRSKGPANLENNEESSPMKKKRGSKAPTNLENSEESPSINAEVQEVSDETEDDETAPKETKKTPSRSARRKYAKRRWLREMKNIQKQNASGESEGLKNWREDKAKAERKKVDDQWKTPRWNKHQPDAEIPEVDGQPKGLLHWKQSSQHNTHIKDKSWKERNQKVFRREYSNQNGAVQQHSNQENGDAQKHPSQENGDAQKHPNQENGNEQKHPNQENGNEHDKSSKIGDAPEQTNQESDLISDQENEVVPIVIKPGHIRFEPLDEEQAIQLNHVPSETFQWNGITSKKKGQKWGMANGSFTPRNDYKNSNKEYPEILSKENDKKLEGVIEFDKLSPLHSMPKEGDVIAYRILELLSSWTPELSVYRVGKVSLYSVESNQIKLVPVAEHPIVSLKADEDQELDNTLYKEDGTLEIDFASLVDVRTVKDGNGDSPKTVLPNSNEKETVVPDPVTGESEEGKETQTQSEEGKEPQTPNAEKSGVSLWDQITDALNAKKEQLHHESSWGKNPKSLQLVERKKIQTLPVKNSFGKQNSGGNNFGKQNNSGGKPWSYKGLRGGGLGPTMAALRSKNEIGK